jgi:polyhydroxyalkanoate synthesis regulator phasin
MTEASKLHVNYSHYREGTLGTALQETLDEFVEEGVLTAEQAVRALQQFDVEMNRHLEEQEKLDSMCMQMEGTISHYRNAENVWNWQLEGATAKFAALEAGLKRSKPIALGRVKVIATDAFPGRVSARAGRKKSKPVVEGAARVVKVDKKKPRKKREREEKD